MNERLIDVVGGADAAVDERDRCGTNRRIEHVERMPGRLSLEEHHIHMDPLRTKEPGEPGGARVSTGGAATVHLDEAVEIGNRWVRRHDPLRGVPTADERSGKRSG